MNRPRISFNSSRVTAIAPSLLGLAFALPAGVVRADDAVASPAPVDRSQTLVENRVALFATVIIPADARDRSGLEGMVGAGVPHDRLGAFGSGIDFLGKDGLFVAAADRGPGDGVAKFRCRIHTFRLTLRPEALVVGERAGFELVSTTLLSDRQGRPLMGWSGDIDQSDDAQSTRFDPEGIRAAGDGSVYISDEYGPWIDQFDSSGTRTRRIEIPSLYRVDAPAREPRDEFPPKNTSGRQPNRGFEGLALSTDGSTLYAFPQSPLMQDGAFEDRVTDPKRDEPKRAGHNIRVLVIDTKTGVSRQLVYVLDSAKHGVSAAVADADGSLLVLERDSKGGRSAQARRIYRAEPEGASDVSRTAALPREPLSSNAQAPALRPMIKRLLIDLLDPRFALTGNDMPEKIEGLSWGPNLSDGRRTLVVSSDNDMKTDEPTRIWVFALGDVRP